MTTHEDALEAYHKRQYVAALEYAQVEGPAWEALTDDQRENIRRINRQHSDFMNRLGRAIHDGTALPNPMDIGE